MGYLIGTDAQGNQYSIIVNPADLSLTMTPVQQQTPSTADNSITTNAQAVITSALKLINVLAAGEQLPIEMANDALLVLDQMVDSWNAERLTVYAVRSDDYALTIGKQSYTLGPGGDFNTNRPAKITGMSAILLTNPTNPIEVPITMYSVDDWQNKLPVKAVGASFPQVCYDDCGNPLRTLNFWPYPTQANNVRIYSWQGLGVPSTQQTSLNYPPGYAEAFRYNLAVRLAAEFAQPLSPAVQTLAVESLARVKTMNAPMLEMKSDLLATEGGYNYRADLFGIPF